MNADLLKKLNQYLADTGVMYIKLHNLHWNVSGLQFKAVHEYLEELYDGITENMDEIAEVLRMHGEYPVASMADFLEIASIKELSPEKVEVKKALSVALADLKTLDAEAKAIRAAADEEDLFDVVAMMEDQCGEFQKTIWFIESMLV